MLINKIELVILFNDPAWHKSKWNETKHFKLENSVLATTITENIKDKGWDIRGSELDPTDLHTSLPRPSNSSESWVGWDIYYTDEVGPKLYLLVQ